MLFCAPRESPHSRWSLRRDDAVVLAHNVIRRRPGAIRSGLPRRLARAVNRQSFRRENPSESTSRIGLVGEVPGLYFSPPASRGRIGLHPPPAARQRLSMRRSSDSTIFPLGSRLSGGSDRFRHAGPGRPTGAAATLGFGRATALLARPMRRTGCRSGNTELRIPLRPPPRVPRRQPSPAATIGSSGRPGGREALSLTTSSDQGCNPRTRPRAARPSVFAARAGATSARITTPTWSHLARRRPAFLANNTDSFTPPNGVDRRVTQPPFHFQSPFRAHRTAPRLSSIDRTGVHGVCFFVRVRVRINEPPFQRERVLVRGALSNAAVSIIRAEHRKAAIRRGQVDQGQKPLCQEKPWDR